MFLQKRVQDVACNVFSRGRRLDEFHVIMSELGAVLRKKQNFFFLLSSFLRPFLPLSFKKKELSYMSNA